MATNGNPRQDPYIEHLDFLLSSFQIYVHQIEEDAACSGPSEAAQ